MGVITATIKSDGQLMDPAYELLYIDICKEFNRIPSAEICLIDGAPASQEFKISDSDFFVPGKEVEIKLKYEEEARDEKTVFKGVVTKQSLQLRSKGSVLVVELTDTAVKMTGCRKSLIFNDVKDSDIIKKLISSSGLKAGKIDATQTQHKELVQYYVSDWDFMLMRAEVNSLLILANDGEISAIVPAIGSGTKHTYELGIDELYDFELEADARHQHKTIESSVWDIKNQKLTAPKKAKDFKLSQGDLKPDGIALKIGGESDTLKSVIAVDVTEAQAWADAKMQKDRLSFLRGRIKVHGTAKVLVGDTLEMKGTGKKFSGQALITGVRHKVSAGGWITEIQSGMENNWFASGRDITDTKAAGLIPGVNGLQIGVVEKYEDDPDKELRVKVKVPAIDEEKGSIWSRLTSIDAGKERGVFFRPEPGDEVVLGFLNDDPRQPVILGSMHSSANPSPFQPDDKNSSKGLLTKSGIKIFMDDENQLLSISTSDDNIITIDEKNKFIELADANKNSIKMSADGIELNSDKDLKINIKGNIEMTASSNVKIKGSKIDII